MARTKMTNSEKVEVAAVREYLKALEQQSPDDWAWSSSGST
jgi:hypothetical protein